MTRVDQQAAALAEELVQATALDFDDINLGGDLGRAAWLSAEDWSKEDENSGRNVMVLRIDDRIWHAAVTVTLTEQTVRTRTAEQKWLAGEDDDEDAPAVTA
jgi:hypothetical protein